jgi:hypothetical protein
MNNKKVPKIISKYDCFNCHYFTTRKSQYERHLKTFKHINAINSDVKCSDNYRYICECGKEYKHRQNLHTHKKKCNYKENKNIIIESEGEKIDYKTLLIKMMKENDELRTQVTELIPKIGNNNQKFNINVFLNEKCKDAVTMEQFMKKIEVTLSNLMVTKNKGIDEGISNIFIENINKLSLYERPIHCTDIKREIVYIKSDADNGDSKWEKDEENEKLKKVIKNVAHIQQKNLTKWVDLHPNWQANSELQDEYMKLVRSCTDDIKDNKVIKKICSKGEPCKG